MQLTTFLRSSKASATSPTIASCSLTTRGLYSNKSSRRTRCFARRTAPSGPCRRARQSTSPIWQTCRCTATNSTPQRSRIRPRQKVLISRRQRFLSSPRRRTSSQGRCPFLHRLRSSSKCPQPSIFTTHSRISTPRRSASKRSWPKLTKTWRMPTLLSSCS